MSHGPVADGQWVLMISFKKKDFVKPAIMKAVETTLDTILTLLVILLTDYFAIRLTLIKNIVLTSEILEDISQNENDLTASLQVITNDEMGGMAKFFNMFMPVYAI